MLMKYVVFVVLLMDSTIKNSLAVTQPFNVSVAWAKTDQLFSDFDCEKNPIAVIENVEVRTFAVDGTSCCANFSSPIPLIICANLRNLSNAIDISGAHLVLINSTLKIEPHSVASLHRLSIISGSKVVVGNSHYHDVAWDKECYRPEMLANETSLNVKTLEVLSSSLQYISALSLPKITNLTVVNSSISANILDLSWTMESSIESISVINSTVAAKPCNKVKCVSKTFKKYKKPKSLQYVSFKGTEFRCLYIATSQTQWYSEVRGQMVDQNMNCTAELAEFGRSSYFRISDISETFKDIIEDCPGNCCCWPGRMENKNHGFDYTVEVDCSDRGLTEIPKLPKHVSSLNISNNQIKSLKNITDGEQILSKLRVLRADHNKLQSIKELDGSYFSKHFTVLSVSSNQITIDESLMAFVENRQKTDNNGSGVWIANNSKDQCTCDMAKNIRPRLWANSLTIKDHRQIYCMNNTKIVKLLFLYEESICPPAEPSHFNWDILLGIQSAMIALCLSRLLYDFWVYKRTSQLPWVVLKLF